MEEIYSLKPASIFEVGDEEFFFEREEEGHSDYINSGSHYELFYAISKYYDPDSILEIGTRNGYSLYSLSLGSTTLNKIVGYELDSESATQTEKNLTESLAEHIDIRVETINSQELESLDDSYYLIHIDGDTTFEGRYHDLELTRGKARVVLVSDFFSERSGRDAAQRFVYDNRHIIKKTHVIESLRGLYIIEYVG
jgi:predicted O-methyltransferase YrrM